MKPKRTILCVDGSEQALSIRKIMLETRGYRVATFTSAEQAMERFREGGVDLVIADMVLSGVNGSQLIDEVKAASPQTPAILLSTQSRIFNFESRADVFLPKGANAPADLLERVRILLVRKRGPKRASLPALMARVGTA